MLFLKQALATLMLSLLAVAAHADDSLYQSLGGKDGIRKFTAEFVQIIAKDPRIADKFVDADLQRLELLLSEQFCMLAGGPCQYKGVSMKEAHGQMGVTNAKFNALAEDLQIAMENNGVPSRAALQLVALLAPMQREIVTK
jgi:hemoglobin